MGLSLPVIEAAPAAPAEAAEGPLRDAYGRAIRDLRLSLTDRCNFRCVYCLDPDVRFMERNRLLTAAQLLACARVCVGLGVRKIRLTGGEPTLHPELDAIIAGCAALGVEDLAMTTNGALADRAALERWRALGLDRITFSLDSVRPDRFAQMTRSTASVEQIIDAIASAKQAGLDPVRINAVIVRGFNEDEVAPLAGLARDLGVEVRFIEFMPLDAGHRWDRNSVVAAAEIRARIEQRWPLAPIGRDEPSATALKFRFADGAPGGVGLIAPVTRSFCGACSRLRITADGKVRPCLFSRDEWDIRPLLRDGADDVALERFIRGAVWQKQAGHGIGAEDFEQPERTMSAIGG
ncbi:MAG: GTP 3',8-cyclase MoaA [Phycisphaerales bacterium JB039]